MKRAPHLPDCMILSPFIPSDALLLSAPSLSAEQPKPDRVHVFHEGGAEEVVGRVGDRIEQRLPDRELRVSST
jgi:hypothetical protein